MGEGSPGALPKKSRFTGRGGGRSMDGNNAERTPCTPHEKYIRQVLPHKRSSQKSHGKSYERSFCFRVPGLTLFGGTQIACPSGHPPIPKGPWKAEQVFWEASRGPPRDGQEQGPSRHPSRPQISFQRGFWGSPEWIPRRVVLGGLQGFP